MQEKLLEELRSYENKWVAILKLDERIVGAGDDALQAKLDAEGKGYRDFILLRVFPFNASYIPAL